MGKALPGQPFPGGRAQCGLHLPCQSHRSQRLLADLGKAPSLAEIARESGMSEPMSTRGFRQLFSNSVYGFFQQACMLQARSRLLNGEESVMRVASELGYANVSFVELLVFTFKHQL